MGHCDGHGEVELIVICKHLFNGTSHRWVPVGIEPGKPPDYVCQKCSKDFPNISPDQLTCVCVQCADGLRERSAGMN